MSKELLARVRQIQNDRASAVVNRAVTRDTVDPPPVCQTSAHEPPRQAVAAAASASPQPKQAKKPKKWKGPPQNLKQRLPDDSEFHVRWDEAAQKWSGSLSIHRGEAFATSASGVFRLLMNLDDMYRASLAVGKEGGSNGSTSVIP